MKIPLLFSLLLSSACLGDINLTPMESTYELEGFKFPNVSFKFDGKTVSYVPIRNWHYTGSHNRFTMCAKGAMKAEASICTVPVASPIAFDEEQMKRFERETVAVLPVDAEKVTVISQEKNPLYIGGKETLETIVSYVFYGRATQMGVLYVNMGKTLLRFELVCDLKDFPQAHEQFRRSLYSWRGI
jgi:hypothetical protein